MNSTISIIIATFNRREMLKQAILSVAHQKEVNKEIIVVDDNSNDGTDILIKRLCIDINNNQNLNTKLIYFRNSSNKGLLYNHSFGYSKTTGDYIVFMDDDDYYTDNNYFKKAVRLLQKDESLSFVAANCNNGFVKTGKIIPRSLNVNGFITNKEYLSKFQFHLEKPASTFTAMFSKRKLDLAGFREMEVMNYSSIYMRSLLVGGAYVFDDIVGVYRIHGNNRSCDNDKYFLLNIQEKYRILKDGVGIIESPHSWWYHQFKLTYQYYFTAKHSISYEKEIVNWGLKNTGGSLLLKFYLLKRKFILMFK